MKLCFSTLGCPEWGLEEIINAALRYGFDCVELRGISGNTDVYTIPEFSDGLIRDTARAFENNGLKVAVVGASACFHDEKRADGCLAEAKRTVDICAHLKAPYVRVFGNDIPDAVTEDETVNRVSDYIRVLCDYALGKNVSVLLEVHGDFNTKERLLAVEKAVSRENFGLIWDVAHSDRAYGDGFLDFYESVKHMIRHVHIKDHKRIGGDFELCDIGRGDIPLKSILQTLINDGYDGCLSVEWEKKWHAELRCADEVFPEYVSLMKGLYNIMEEKS